MRTNLEADQTAQLVGQAHNKYIPGMQTSPSFTSVSDQIMAVLESENKVTVNWSELYPEIL